MGKNCAQSVPTWYQSATKCAQNLPLFGPSVSLTAPVDGGLVVGLVPNSPDGRLVCIGWTDLILLSGERTVFLDHRNQALDCRAAELPGTGCTCDPEGAEESMQVTAC